MALGGGTVEGRASDFGGDRAGREERRVEVSDVAVRPMRGEEITGEAEINSAWIPGKAFGSRIHTGIARDVGMPFDPKDLDGVFGACAC